MRPISTRSVSAVDWHLTDGLGRNIGDHDCCRLSVGLSVYRTAVILRRYDARSEVIQRFRPLINKSRASGGLNIKFSRHVRRASAYRFRSVNTAERRSRKAPFAVGDTERNKSISQTDGRTDVDRRPTPRTDGRPTSWPPVLTRAGLSHWPAATAASF